MKKISFTAYVLLLLFFSNTVTAQKYFGTKDYDPGQKHLVLAHPTVYNLKTFVNLIEKELIDLPGTRIVGVFHEKESYNYEHSVNFLDSCTNLPVDILLHQLKDIISVGDLYRFNSLTNDFKTIFRATDGIVFFGGPDMPPATYGEQTNLLTAISDPYRHYFELSFLFHLTGGKQNSEYEPLLEEKPDYLIYGFCLGMQTMNVAAGGTMIQDIPTEIYQYHYVEELVGMPENQTHRNYYRNISTNEKLLSGSFHQIQIKAGSFLEKLDSTNITPLVYSNHHQCVDEVGLNYLPLAYSMDNKIVEALRHEQYANVIGVQFHPEAMRLYNEDIRFRTEPETPLKKGKDVLQQANSYHFHEAYWNDFSRRFNAIDR